MMGPLLCDRFDTRGLDVPALRVIEALATQDDEAVRRAAPEFLARTLTLSGPDPLHRRWWAVLVDLWANTGEELLRDPLFRPAFERLQALRDESTTLSRALWRASDRRPVACDTPERFLRLSLLERLMLQGAVLEAGDHDCGYWNSVDLGAAFRHFRGGTLLNAGDPVTLPRAASHGTLSETIVRQLAAGVTGVEAIESFDVVAPQDADVAALARALTAYHGEHFTLPPLRVSRLDAVELPFVSEQFALVVSGGMLDHVADHARAFVELLRVARVGAPVFVSGHHLGLGLEPVERLMFAIGEDGHVDVGRGVVTAVQVDALLELAEAHGARLVHEVRRARSWVLGFIKESHGAR